MTGVTLRVSGLVLAAVVGVACGAPTAKASRAVRLTKPTAMPIVKTNAAPLVLETGVPARPPKIELVARRGTGAVAQLGIPFSLDWTVGRVAEQLRPHYPVPWPRASTIDRADTATLTLDTRIAPDWVVVKSYARVEDGSLVPEPKPIGAFGCVRLAEPRCDIEATASGLHINGVAPAISSGPYVVVFCMWHVPLAIQQAQSRPRYEVAASWLFHISSRPVLGAARP
jgi:hypothetical protein